MKMIIDTAKTDFRKKIVNSIALFVFAVFLFLVFLEYGWEEMHVWVSIIVLAPFYWMVRFIIRGKEVGGELHMVRLGRIGITGWDMRGKMMTIKWDEVSQVLEQRNMLGRELVINGPHRRRLKITENFPKFDLLSETIRDICNISGARYMGMKGREDDYGANGFRQV